MHARALWLFRVLSGYALLQSVRPADTCDRDLSALTNVCSRRIVDLSYPFNNETLYWNEDDRFRLNITTIDDPSFGWYQADVLTTATHGGTHLDAPVHFDKNGWTASQIPLWRLVGIPIALIDVKTKAANNSDYQLSIGDLQRWESKHGPLPNDSLIVMRSGRGRLWPNRTQYFGLDEDGNRHYPSIRPRTARWLTTQRRIYGVGLDTPSVDRSNSSRTHRILAAKNMYNIENMANLNRVPARGATALVMPMKNEGASGAPVRVAAILP
ncbi:isatin hydrolase-like [Ornithodoros turicata]|uniref:isatin hydrolase-like n=1 Tax=Ornithodoros turicata TaxID=34597 RepID=UPI0031394BEF